MIKIFKTLDDALEFITIEHVYQDQGDYFKAELLVIPDGRYRVGIITEAQYELFD